MSALKEDKRLLELQMKSKQAPITRSVGVGDFPVDDPVDKVPTVPTSKPRPRDGTDSPFDIETLKRMNELNKKPTRDFGVGDGNVFAVETTTTDVGPVRIHERDVSTEQNTEVKEKEIKTVFLSGKSKDAVGVFGGQVKPKQTRTIGVGDDKVFEETEPTTTPQVGVTMHCPFIFDFNSCISHGNFVRSSVCLSVCLPVTYAGIVPR